ncbi:hypothetical protein NB697_003511 [Xanthomonas sacchari]|nr:hypothetical protein [Xanthomonas sacchari]
MGRPPLDKVRLVKKCTLTPVSPLLLDADAAAAFGDLIAESRVAMIPNLRRFPRIRRP